jgi:hypothetical protein
MYASYEAKSVVIFDWGSGAEVVSTELSRIVEGEGAVAGAVWCSGQSPSSAFPEPLAVATPLPLTSKNEIVSGTGGGGRGCGPRISGGSIVVVLIPPSEAPEPLVLLPSVDVGSG